MTEAGFGVNLNNQPAGRFGVAFSGSSRNPSGFVRNMEIEMWQVPRQLVQGASNIPPDVWNVPRDMLCRGLLEGVVTCLHSRSDTPLTPVVTPDADYRQQLLRRDGRSEGGIPTPRPTRPDTTQFLEGSPFRPTKATSPEFCPTSVPEYLALNSNHEYFGNKERYNATANWRNDALMNLMQSHGFPGVQVVDSPYNMVPERPTSMQPPQDASPQMRRREVFQRPPQGREGRSNKGTETRKPKKTPSPHKLCRYGDKCYTEDCKFGHPNKKPLFIPKYKKENNPPQ